MPRTSRFARRTSCGGSIRGWCSMPQGRSRPPICSGSSATGSRSPGSPADLSGEVVTTVKELVEGTCVKHRVLQNSMKMYDKFGQVLRLENLLINVRDFKVFRMREGDTDGPMEYLRPRKGVADIHRRAELGRRLTSAMPKRWPRWRIRRRWANWWGIWASRRPGRAARCALNPLAPEDVQLLEAINRGEFVINGFRNRDLRALLFTDAASASPEEAKRQAAKVTRLLGLLLPPTA